VSTLSIFDAARSVPDDEALVCAGERLSFAELAQRSAARARELVALGVEPANPRPVALLVDQSTAQFELLHALIALGVPILPLHPRLTAPERAVLIEASGAELMLDPSTLARVAGFPPSVPFAQAIVPGAHPLAYVPSSGSSGRPKLVELSRSAFLALARADALRVAPERTDRALLCLPLSHVGGLSVVLRCVFARRACVVFDTKRGLLQAAPELARCLERERISLLSLVPPVLARLLREAPAFAKQSVLRAVLIGGQACEPELFDEARARGVPVLTSYGLTETCSQVSTLAFPLPRRMAARHGVSSSGFALPGMELRVRNQSIQVRGPSLFTRYLGQAAAIDEEGFFHTGDRGELDAELGLFVFGRESELIVTGGENVDPSEVEHALLRTGLVSAACVFGVADSEFGEVVAVALELADAHAECEAALFRALNGTLARFKQPRLVSIHAQLPRLASGKLDRVRARVEAQPRLRRPVRD